MAPVPEKMIPTIEDAFVADRVMFWARFTTFSKYAIAAVIVVLALLWLFMG